MHETHILETKKGVWKSVLFVLMKMLTFLDGPLHNKKWNIFFKNS